MSHSVSFLRSAMMGRRACRAIRMNAHRTLPKLWSPDSLTAFHRGFRAQPAFNNETLSISTLTSVATAIRLVNTRRRLTQEGFPAFAFFLIFGLCSPYAELNLVGRGYGDSYFSTKH